VRRHGAFKGPAVVQCWEAMERRRIGSLEVSVVGLGGNNFGLSLDAAATAAVVRSALDTGIDFFDTADSYGGTRSEEFLGRALRGRRDEAVIATKFGMPIDERQGGGRPEYVRQALEESLQRLQTDRVELYQLHLPDPVVPIEETLGVLDELKQAGKIREIGCSNYSVEQLRAAAEAHAPGETRLASVQNEYSLLQREAERSLLPECERMSIAFLPYYPLASGVLTGKYRLGVPPPEGSRFASGPNAGASVAEMTPALVESLRRGELPRIPRRRERLSERNLNLVESLIRFAEAQGHTLLELAFSWLLSRPVVASVIAGATRPDQVRANAAAADWRLSSDELAEIDAILA
jgi:aryl-alcohol dehydrogenase-like predicted oxidoreductase